MEVNEIVNVETKDDRALHVMPTDSPTETSVVEDNHVKELLGQLIDLRKTADEVEQKEKLIKAEMEKIMTENNLESVESYRFDRFISVAFVKGSESESVDLKKFQKDDPSLYKQLLEDYKKVTVKKPYVRVTVKELADKVVKG